jgi:hypothetical protein
MTRHDDATRLQHMLEHAEEALALMPVPKEVGLLQKI